MLNHWYISGINIRADVTRAEIYEHGSLTTVVPVVPVSADSMPQNHIDFMGYIFGADAAHALYVEWVGDGWAAYSHVVDDDDLAYGRRIKIVDDYDHYRDAFYTLYDPRTGKDVGRLEYRYYSDTFLRWTDDLCSWLLTFNIQHNGDFEIEMIFAHGRHRYSGNTSKLSFLPTPNPNVRIFDRVYDGNYMICVELNTDNTMIRNIYKWSHKWRAMFGSNELNEQPQRTPPNTIIVLQLDHISITWNAIGTSGSSRAGHSLMWMLYLEAKFRWRTDAASVCTALDITEFPDNIIDANDNDVVCKAGAGRMKITSYTTGVVITVQLHDDYIQLQSGLSPPDTLGEVYTWNVVQKTRSA